MVYSYKRIKVTKTPFVFMILCSLFHRQFKPFFLEDRSNLEFWTRCPSWCH